MIRKGGVLILLTLLSCVAVEEAAGTKAEATAEETAGTKTEATAEATEATKAEAAAVETAGTKTEAPPQNSTKDDDQSKLDLAGKFILKSYSTRTWTFLSSFTSTVPYTCYTTGANMPALCMRRRLRRSKKIHSDLDSALDPTSLSSSGPEDMDAIDTEERNAEQKFFFRLYRTVSSTATITTFSTNRSVTVSASVMCTYAGFTYNVC